MVTNAIKIFDILTIKDLALRKVFWSHQQVQTNTDYNLSEF